MNGVRIAMWSCPRSLGTAMMRAWESRADTTVSDEPLYDDHLARTRARHPGAAAAPRSLGTDVGALRAQLLAPVAEGRIHYQKHMAHHVPGDLFEAIAPGLRHAVLVRHPARQLTSLARVLPKPSLESSGWPALQRLFAALDERVPVVDADVLLADPPRVLAALCARLRVPFDPAMCGWRAGRRSTDGWWAEHWYGEVERSTGFNAPTPLPAVAAELAELHAHCLSIYLDLAMRALH